MDLIGTLQKINSHYGRGDVVSLVFNHGNGTGVATVHYGWVGKGQMKFVENRLFSVKDGRVRFRGVTRKIV
jgi:hypothetical protein